MHHCQLCGRQMSDEIAGRFDDPHDTCPVCEREAIDYINKMDEQWIRSEENVAKAMQEVVIIDDTEEAIQGDE